MKAWRTYAVQLAANERRVLDIAAFTALYVPVQGLNRDIPADALRVSFGRDSDSLPVTEGFFFNSDKRFTSLVLVNTSGSAISFELATADDETALVIRGL